MTRATTFRATAIVGGFLLAILMIMTVSRAAFSDTTENTGNTWGAGEVILEDDDADSALFVVDNIVPGDSGSGCIAVIYKGTVPAGVVLSSVSTAGSTGLAPALDITIDRYPDPGCTGSPTPVYDDTLAAAPTGSFTGSWNATPAAPPVYDTRYYKITWTFPVTEGNSYQGKTAQAAFTWQATS